MSIPPATPPAKTGRTSSAGNGIAHVYELDAARRRRAAPDPPVHSVGRDRIPDEVWEEVEAAARLFDRLHAEGSRIVFDTERRSGHVVASLLDGDGNRQGLPLGEAVDPAASRVTRSPGPMRELS